MSVLARLLAPAEARSSPANVSQWILEAFAGPGSETAAGVQVTPDNSLEYPAVWAAVRVLSESVASLPLLVYERLEPRGKRRARNHPLYPVLHDAPNPEMTAFEWREAAMVHLCTWGNHFSEIEWSRAGQVAALWPLRPDRVKVRREGSRLFYDVELPDQTVRTLRPYQILHIRGLGSNGIVGYSPSPGASGQALRRGPAPAPGIVGRSASGAGQRA